MESNRKNNVKKNNKAPATIRHASIIIVAVQCSKW